MFLERKQRNKRANVEIPKDIFLCSPQGGQVDISKLEGDTHDVLGELDSAMGIKKKNIFHRKCDCLGKRKKKK